MRRTFLAAVALLVAAPVCAQEAPLALTGEAAETFLKTAQITAIKDFSSKGITKKQRVTLTSGDITADAVFKTVDEYHVKTKLTSGHTVLGMRDSYRNEIAAYELAKLLGLDFVPPTVERKIHDHTGALILWVNGAMTEWHRLKVEKIKPPDIVAWNNQMSTIRLFMHLTWDTDYNNISNLLIDQNWKLWKIDSSRAFLPSPKLRREASLVRFSRPFLAALEGLTRARLDEVLGPWLRPEQLDGLWARRTAILEVARRRVAQHGEAAVLYGGSEPAPAAGAAPADSAGS